MPFGTLIALFLLWFGISVPLVFVGSYFGYKKPAPDDPVRTNKIPRQIPEQARLLCRACHTSHAGLCDHLPAVLLVVHRSCTTVSSESAGVAWASDLGA